MSTCNRFVHKKYETIYMFLPKRLPFAPQEGKDGINVINVYGKTRKRQLHTVFNSTPIDCSLSVEKVATPEI